MKETRLLMGMPITLEIMDGSATQANIQEIFSYFMYIDDTFSTYKQNSEITKVNNGLIQKEDYSHDMKTILALCEQTKNETNGYFDSSHNGSIDPSGLVKGWAIYQASLILKKNGFSNFYIDAGGDVQTSGKNGEGTEWAIGIRNPFNREEVIKVITIVEKGVATSGTYIRGQHIYDPHNEQNKLRDIVSLTVIGPNVYEADRYATAAFAMGKKGVLFIESLRGFEGYAIDDKGTATYTNGFNAYVKNSSQ